MLQAKGAGKVNGKMGKRNEHIVMDPVLAKSLRERKAAAGDGMIRCFLVEPANEARIVAHATWGTCPFNPGQPHFGRAVAFHGTQKQVDEIWEQNHKRLWSADTSFTCVCHSSGTRRSPESVGKETSWQSIETMEVKENIEDFGPGAMWRTPWFAVETMPDGRIRYGMDWSNQFEPPLHVMTPGGEWCIDARASNCGKPNDTVHRCWCRHGDVPNITVDKRGATCKAGQGSIRLGAYHGFLRDGYLAYG